MVKIERDDDLLFNNSPQNEQKQSNLTEAVRKDWFKKENKRLEPYNCEVIDKNKSVKKSEVTFWKVFAIVLLIIATTMFILHYYQLDSGKLQSSCIDNSNVICNANATCPDIPTCPNCNCPNLTCGAVTVRCNSTI